MKAARLLHLLLLLQTRQRITTAELAERLEVSRRTVLRDVEALSAAGVPVYAERGRHGGIVLLPGARLNASHLDPPELEVLSVAGLDRAQLSRLGLSAQWETAAHKIAARQAAAPAVPAAPAAPARPAAPAAPARSAAPAEPAAYQRMPRLSDLVLVESSGWFDGSGAGGSEATVEVADLATALRHRRQLRIRYRRSAENRASTRVVDPYGLVAKSGRWYLVADDQGESRLFALERLSHFEQLETPAATHPNESLRTRWAALKEFTEGQGRVEVTIRLPVQRLDLARRILGARINHIDEPEPESEPEPERGTCILVVRYPDVESVRQLLQFGDHLEVLAPEAARVRVRELARDLLERHA